MLHISFPVSQFNLYYNAEVFYYVMTEERRDLGGIYCNWEVTHMGPSGTKRNMEQSQVKKIHLANDFLLLQFWKNTMWDLL